MSISLQRNIIICFLDIDQIIAVDTNSHSYEQMLGTLDDNFVFNLTPQNASWSLDRFFPIVYDFPPL